MPTTIQSALLFAETQLSHLANARFESQVVLAYLLNVNRSHLIAFPEKELTSNEWLNFQILITQRQKGIPFAYISGFKEFYGLTFKVTQDTLIPRDDTEIIVTEALSRIPENQPFTILDLGTGSGVIALTIKHYRPNAKVTAVDFNLKTLAIAQENARSLNIEVEFIHSNWFAQLENNQFNLIISNPPYIDPQDPHLQKDGICFEPKEALISGHHGLHDLYKIIDTAPNFLKNGGYLILEHGYNQAKSLQDHLKHKKYQQIETIQDYNNNDRVTFGCWLK